MPSGDPASFAAPANARVLTFAPHGPLLDFAGGSAAAADAVEALI